MTPKPGFGGKALQGTEKAALGIASDVFAYRVTYLVTWGPHAATGRNAAKAGLRKGDVVVSLDGKSDFQSEAHVHTWFRLTRTPGSTVAIETIRKGQRRTVALPVVK